VGLTVQGDPVLYLLYFLWHSVRVNSTLFQQNGDWWTDGNVCVRVCARARMIAGFCAVCLHQIWEGVIILLF